MHEPTKVEIPEAAVSLEQEILDYFGPDDPAAENATNSDDAQSELTRLRQNSASMRQQLFELCWRFQHDCDSVDLVEMFSLVARMKRSEQTETGLAKRLQGG